MSQGAYSQADQNRVRSKPIQMSLLFTPDKLKNQPTTEKKY